MPSFPSADYNCFVAGFGETESASNAAFLQEMKVTVVDNVQCDPVDQTTVATDAAGTNAGTDATAADGTTTTNDAAATPTVSDTICVQARNQTEGAVGHNVGACRGDTGGPLICVAAADTNNEPLLVGIVGPDYGCASPNEFAKYGSVQSAREWITRVISDDQGEANADDPNVYDRLPEGWNQPNAVHYQQTADISMASCTDGSAMSFVGYQGTEPITLKATLPEGAAAGEETYAPNLQCTWTIRVPVGQAVQVCLYFY